MKRRLLCATAVCVVFFGAAWWAFCFRAGLFPLTATWLDIGGPPMSVDHVMLLPGSTETRPFVAAAMVRCGLAKSVLIPQTQVSPAVEDGILPPEHETLSKAVAFCNVRPEQIQVLPGSSGTTMGDAVALKHFLDDHPGAKVAVVTDGYHTRRARLAFRSIVRPYADQLSFVSAPSEIADPSHWWLSQRGTWSIVTEHIKLAEYALRFDARVRAALVGVLLIVISRWLWVRRRAQSQE